MAFEESQPILCGRCRVAVEVSTASGGEAKVRCPKCGRTDTLDDARREAAQHTAHKLLSAMLRDLRTNDQAELSFQFVEGGGRRPAQAEGGPSSDRANSRSFPR